MKKKIINFNKKELTPSTVTKRKDPENLKKEDEHLFQHEAYKNINAVYNLTIKNILFTGWGTIVIPNNKNLPPEFEYPTTTILKQSIGLYYFNLIKSALKGDLLIIRQPVIFILENSSMGYFHWVTDVLPRLMVVEENKKFPVVLPQSFREVAFINDSLDALGFKTIFLREEQNALLQRMNFITHFAKSGNYNDEMINKLRDSFYKSYNLHQNSDDLIYISRSKSSKRKIKNEDEVWGFLKQFSFKKIYCEDLSFENQAKLFSKSRLIISIHGAGLTNMLFMNKAGKVLEVRYAADQINNCYYTLASALKLKYYYLQCQPVTLGENQHTADLSVDMALFKNTVKNMVSSINGI